MTAGENDSIANVDRLTHQTADLPAWHNVFCMVSLNLFCITITIFFYTETFFMYTIYKMASCRWQINKYAIIHGKIFVLNASRSPNNCLNVVVNFYYKTILLTCFLFPICIPRLYFFCISFSPKHNIFNVCGCIKSLLSFHWKDQF